VSRAYVRIENPPPGHRDQTTLNRARRYERAGRAKFVEPMVIRFLDTPIQRKILKSAKDRELAAISGGNYDRVNRMFVDEARRLPLIDPQKMIREEKSKRDWSYRAGVRSNVGRREHSGAEVAAMRARSPSRARHPEPQSQIPITDEPIGNNPPEANRPEA